MFKCLEYSRCQSKDITETIRGISCQYIGVVIFFFLFLGPGLKLDEKSIEHGLELQTFSVGCLFWG